MLVSIEMLILSVMGVISMSREFFSALVGMEFRSHDFDDEPKKGFLISSSVTHSKSFILDSISGFLHFCNIWYFMHKFGTKSFNFM